MPDEYNFLPRTWILPADYSILQNYAKEMKMKKKSKTFIAKPSNGAQGHGYDCLPFSLLTTGFWISR